jgi:hypothetical protein
VNDTVTIQDIQRATGLTERSVMRWFRKVTARPVRIEGRVHHYAPDIIPLIQAAQITASEARANKIRAAVAPRVISVREAKRRAKGGRR